MNGTWRQLGYLSSGLAIMVCDTPAGTAYAPGYRHTLRLAQSHKQTEAEQFLARHPDPTELTHVADKLRWHRHRLGLRQRDVADVIGVNRKTYVHYEDGVMERYPPDKLQIIGSLFGVDVTEIMDDYNLFLYRGQGRQVQASRQSMGLPVAEFAERMKVYPSTVRDWEAERITMTKTMWRRQRIE